MLTCCRIAPPLPPFLPAAKLLGSVEPSPAWPHASDLLFSARPEGNPAEALIVSHRYVLRTGMITQQAAGIYPWLPLGLRVLSL